MSRPFSLGHSYLLTPTGRCLSSAARSPACCRSSRQRGQTPLRMSLLDHLSSSPAPNSQLEVDGAPECFPILSPLGVTGFPQASHREAEG